MPLALLTAACIVVGTWARFHGLDRWPLAIDEYYFARSVENLLHFGIPEYPCGGLYIRGLSLQYLCAALQWAGMSAELAPRLLAAIASLLTLPPAYLIARRFGRPELGLLTVCVLALSVWEVEIGRFGRMYAPFQAVFAWYVLFFLRYVVDGDRRSLWPMLGLSAFGLTVWEGGVFLVLANFLPPLIGHPEGRFGRREWLYLAGCSLLLIPAYALTVADLRFAGGEPALPPGYVETDTPSQSRLDAAVMPFTTLRSHPGWLLLGVLPLGLTLYGLVSPARILLRSPPKPLAFLALAAIVFSVVLQQFQLAAGLMLISLLLGVLSPGLLLEPRLRLLQFSMLAWLAYWVSFGMATSDWLAPGTSTLQRVLLLGYELVRFPDTVRQIATPWARAVPHLALGLFILVGSQCLRACLRFETTALFERVLLALFVILMLAAAASNPPRTETRYVFFLYPLAVIFSIVAIHRAVSVLLGPAKLTSVAVGAACAGAFVLSEDFRPHHLWNIDTEEVNFRIGISGRLAGHYHPRSDVRAAADWLRAHVVRGQDIVIDSFPGVDFYYRAADFYFITQTDPRFEVYSCRRGTVQRWSNLPMIDSYDGLLAKAASGHRLWLVLEESRMPDVTARLPAGEWTVQWTSRKGDISIVSVQETHAISPSAVTESSDEHG